MVFYDIQTAAKKVELRDLQALCGPAEAKMVFAYTLALTDLFARIPIMSPLVESVLKLIPENSMAFKLRKRSIYTTRAFTQLNIAIQEQNFEQKSVLGKQIYKSVKEDIQHISNNPIKQGFEADPYFYLSRVTFLTYGLYNGDEQKKMLDASKRAMNMVVKLDMSKNKAYQKTAMGLLKKISDLQPDASADEANETSIKNH